MFSKRIVKFVVTLCCLLAASSISAVAQAPQKIYERTELLKNFYERCAAQCRPVAQMIEVGQKQKHMMMATAAQVGVPEVYVTVSGMGPIVTGGSDQLTLKFVKDYDRPVFISGRKVTTTNAGYVTVSDEPFYLPPSVATTEWGPGYFEKISKGAVFPVGYLGFNSAGSTVTLQITVFDSLDGGKPIQNVFYTFWSNIRGTTGVPTIPVALASVNIAGSPNLITLVGRFPIGESTILIGQPGWDVRALRVTSSDGKSLSFFVPLDERGIPLYPMGWAAACPWSVDVITPSGNSYSFPNVVTVQSTFGGFSVTVVQ